MRVIQLLPELNEGGVERGTVELNREFVQQQHESIVISRGGILADTIEKDGGRHLHFDVCSKNPLTAPSRILGLRRLLRELEPDLIHARSRVPAWLCHFARQGLKLPLVTTVHGMNRINRYSRIMTTGDRVICVSEIVRDYVAKGYHLDPNQLTVVQRGTDMEYFASTQVEQNWISNFRKEQGLENAWIVTGVGRVTWLKDYESLIRAAAILKEEMPDLRLLIVGGVREDKQDYFNSLKKLAEEVGIEDRISWAGNQQKMREIYSLSDVLVNASLKMGNVGRTVVEALAMDCPVLATRWEGLNTVIEDQVNGYNIETRNPEDLAAKLRLVREAEFTQIRGSIPREFTLEAMVEHVLKVYRSLT